MVFFFFFFYLKLHEASYPTVAATFVLLSRPSRHQLLNLYHEQLLGSACRQQTRDQNTLKKVQDCFHFAFMLSCFLCDSSHMKMCARVSAMVLHALKVKAVKPALLPGVAGYGAAVHWPG